MLPRKRFAHAIHLQDQTPGFDKSCRNVKKSCRFARSHLSAQEMDETFPTTARGFPSFHGHQFITNAAILVFHFLSKSCSVLCGVFAEISDTYNKTMTNKNPAIFLLQKAHPPSTKEPVDNLVTPADVSKKN